MVQANGGHSFSVIIIRFRRRKFRMERAFSILLRSTSSHVARKFDSILSEQKKYLKTSPNGGLQYKPVIKVIVNAINGLATVSQQRFVRRPTAVYYRSAALRSRDQPISMLLIRHDSLMGGKFEQAMPAGGERS